MSRFLVWFGPPGNRPRGMGEHANGIRPDHILVAATIAHRQRVCNRGGARLRATCWHSRRPSWDDRCEPAVSEARRAGSARSSPVTIEEINVEEQMIQDGS